MTINPLQLAFYKGIGGKNGAIQLNLQKPHYFIKGYPKLKNYEGFFIPESWRKDNPSITRDDLVSREGAIFLEITSAKGPNIYDWENKVLFALSVTDMGKILTVLEGLKSDVALTHDPGAKSKTAGQITKRLSISSPKGIATGVLVSILEKSSEKNVKHMVPLSGDEVKVLSICLRAAVPIALGWV